MSRSIAIANMSMDEISEFVGQSNFEEVIEEILPMPSIKMKDRNNKKYDGEFLGFRRIAGSYNQNWPWKDE